MTPAVRVAVLVLLVVLGGVGFPESGGATQESSIDDPTQPSSGSRLIREIRRGFSWRADLRGYGVYQRPVLSRLNFNNSLGFSRYRMQAELRPDLQLRFRRLELGLSPRAEFSWRRWEDGYRSGDVKRDSDVYVHEWLARIRITHQLFASYGREDLQWGPSYLLSVSNPFNIVNGRDNPFAEVPGQDYGKLVYFPGYRWTISLIANTGQGRRELFGNTDQNWSELLGNFEPTYAAKVDYTGTGKHASAILSSREGEPVRLGAYGGIAVSDGLFLYAEGTASEDSEDAAGLIGGSYTLVGGAPTFVVELFHKEHGCTRHRIDQCFRNGGGATPDEVYFRRDYFLVQYIHIDVVAYTNVSIRWIGGLDDGSNRVIGSLEREVGDHVRIFAIGHADLGDKDSEFGSVLRSSVMSGVSYVF